MTKTGAIIQTAYIMTKLLYLWVILLIDTISIIDANLIMYKIKLSQKNVSAHPTFPVFNSDPYLFSVYQVLHKLMPAAEA